MGLHLFLNVETLGFYIKMVLLDSSAGGDYLCKNQIIKIIKTIKQKKARKIVFFHKLIDFWLEQANHSFLRKKG